MVLLSLGVSASLSLLSEDWGCTCLPGGWGRAEAGRSQRLYHQPHHPHPTEGLHWGSCQLWALWL